MTVTAKSYDKLLWGVRFTGSSVDPVPMLIGTLWMDRAREQAYPGEPTRALLFTTRAAAREFCRYQMARWSLGDSIVRQWRVQPVRVREVVAEVAGAKTRLRCGKSARTSTSRSPAPPATVSA